MVHHGDNEETNFSYSIMTNEMVSVICKNEANFGLCKAFIGVGSDINLNFEIVMIWDNLMPTNEIMEMPRRMQYETLDKTST